MPLKAVCFDFQDTLAYYPLGNYAAYVQAAEEHGVSLTQEQLSLRSLEDAWAPWQTPLGPDHSESATSEQSWRAVHAGVHAHRIEEMGVDTAHAAPIADRIIEIQTDPQGYALFDDALPALERLMHAGIESLIVSNHIWRLPEIVVALGIGARLEGVLTSARVGYRKPHPAIYAAALRLAACEPAEVLFVGDNAGHDVEGPQAAGMRALLLDREAATDIDAGVIASLLDVPLE